MDSPRGVVFADLDGTLLDADTYSPEGLQLALAALARRGVRLVACTSKTAAELKALAPRLGLEAPGVVENGAAIVWRFDAGGSVEPLSAGYAAIREAFADLRASLGLPLVGFGDVDAAEVAHRSGLSVAEAERARARTGDEPFWAERALAPAEWARLDAEARARGVVLSRGGRFGHLHGRTDKGTAARRILERLEDVARTAALGDSANDASLLLIAGERFAVRRPDGTVDPVLAALPGVRVMRSPGPAGAREAIEILLREWAVRPSPEAG